MISRRIIAAAAGWRVAEIGFSEAASFLVFLILARLIAPDAFGVVALASITVAFAIPLLSQGLSEAIVQRPRLSGRYLDAAFCVNVALGASMTLLAILAAPLMAMLFSEPRLTLALMALAPVFLLTSAAAVFQAKLRREMRFRTFALRSALAIVAGGLVGTVLAFQGFGFWALVGQQLTHNSVGLAVLVASSDWRPRLRARRAHVREILRFGRFTTAASFTDFAIARLDVLIAGLFLPTAAVALYYFAKRLVFAAGLVTYYSIQQVGLPVLSRALATGAVSERARQTILQTLSAALLLCGPVLAGLAFVAAPFVHLTVGEAWSGAALPLSILAWGSIALGLRMTAGQVLVASGAPSVHARLAGLDAALTLAAVGMGAFFGLGQAALGAALAHAIAAPLALVVLARRFSFDAEALLAALVRGILPTATMALVLVVSDVLFAPSLALTVLIAVATVALTTAVLFRHAIAPWLATHTPGWRVASGTPAVRADTSPRKDLSDAA